MKFIRCKLHATLAKSHEKPIVARTAYPFDDFSIDCCGVLTQVRIYKRPCGFQTLIPLDNQHILLVLNYLLYTAISGRGATPPSLQPLYMIEVLHV